MFERSQQPYYIPQYAKQNNPLLERLRGDGEHQTGPGDVVRCYLYNQKIMFNRFNCPQETVELS